MEAHRKLGSGFLEAVYHEALAILFEKHGVPFQHEVGLPIEFEGRLLKAVYRADFVCFGCTWVMADPFTLSAPEPGFVTSTSMPLDSSV